jgi:integrase
MSQKLTETVVRDLPTPATGNKITYDADVKGFGCRVTASGTRAFVLNYRNKEGRERRYTIGSWPDWKVTAARDEAKELKKRIDRGEDPVEEDRETRTAPTVKDLCDRFLAEYAPRKRPSTERDYRQQITADILPALRTRKVESVEYSDIAELHRAISKRAPTHANRVIALLSRMFNLAIRWGWCKVNPVRGVERNDEYKRRRYLSAEELARLTKALAGLEDQQAANVVRLLLLTGARRGEVLAARWVDIDLEGKVWAKPGATTKTKTEHRVPLSDAACQLLQDVREESGKAEYVFPDCAAKPHRLYDAWADLCEAAKLSDARIHDLRHTYASVLVSAGLSLPIIGALLGHTQPATTARYAHLFDDPLRKATEQAAAIIAGKPSATVVPIKERA